MGSSPAAPTTSSTREHRKSELPVGIWLLVVAAMVVFMVLLGGATRLTESGLSMVDWRPVTGWLPPLTDAAWEAAFADYKNFPEYKLVNRGMTLDEFKLIFGFEYAHRLWGRLIGLAFAVPFVWFALTGRVRRHRLPQLVGLFVLGGLQGAVGWWMVASGLVDRPDVSHLRLATHLGLAVAILLALVWVALDILRPRGRAWNGPATWLAGLGVLGFLQLLSGALVAGLSAGLAYNTFPTMNGVWVPSDAYVGTPLWHDLLWNPTSVQLNHRWGAYLLVAATLATAWRIGWARGTWIVAALALQVTLGIATLLAQVPVWLGVAHQAGALALLLAVLWALHRSLEPAVQTENGDERLRPALRHLS
ncbi:MAG: COX15/CtaA family protein [Alphaproteobacteria bacterium]